jgi:hypothetical protein
MQSWFDINGAPVKILADDADLLAPIFSYLGELSSPPSAHAQFTLTMERCEHLPRPTNFEILAEGMMPIGKGSQILQADEVRWFNVPGALSFEYSLNQPWGRLTLQPGAENILAGMPAIIVVNAILSATGQFLLHAASLRIGNSELAFAIFAHSGAGKTTTTLALTQSGFGFLTDDATVLMPPKDGTSGSFKVWGLPRALKVHYRTRDLLPHLAPLLGPNWNSDGEQVLRRETLSTIADVCPPRPFSLAAVVLLGSRVEGAHVLRQASKTDVMIHLAYDNLRQAQHGVMSDELARFQAISAAVAATPTYELRVGSDLGSVGPLLMSVLGERDNAFCK